MSLFSDHDCKLDGQFVNYFKNAGNSVNLDPGQDLTVSLPIVGGTLTAFVESLDLADPSRIRVVHGPDGGEIEEMQYVRVRAELFSGAVEGDPVRRWTTPDGWKQESDVKLDVNEDTGDFSDGSSTEWLLRVTNTSHRRVRCQAGLRGIGAHFVIQSSQLAQRLINHGFKVVLEALTLRGTISGRVLLLAFGEELTEHARQVGGVQLGALPPIPLPEGLSGEGRLYSTDVMLRSGKVLLEAVDQKWEELKAQEDDDDKLAELQKWRDDWHANVAPDAIVLHAYVVALNIGLNVNVLPGIDVNAIEIARFATDVYIGFDRGLLVGHTFAKANGPVTGGLADLILDDVGPVLEQQASKIDAYTPFIGRYLAEVLLRLAVGGGVFVTAGCDGTKISVRYTSNPDVRRRPPHRPPHVPGDGFAEPPSAEPRSAIPAEFEIHHPETLARLDKIETIVVVMMENRSFDHMLGYLRNARGERYEGLRGNEWNWPVQGVSGTVPVRKAAEEALLDPSGTGRPRTEMLISPYHGHSHVMAQVNGGLMDMFVRDLAGKPGAYAELAMVYYTGAELPTYDEIADKFCVADHWFCAHPGPTWPNRWTTVSGRTPSLENLHIDDPRLGFLTDITMFEALQASGIEFRYFEQDVSILRMFGAYRTEDHLVAPHDGPPDPILQRGEPWEQWDDHFEAVARRGELPPVVFIDPNFVDVPPVSTACDDLAPANLVRGQDFIATVYNILTQSPQWDRMLLVVTYDEHGGFFDHVPPPGTAQTPPPPEFGGAVPRIHPDGPEHLGVRVPALIISPYVNSGSVCKTVFDHTSIMKTILVRHRARIAEHWFTQFGPRVNKANHLGIALELDTPRSDRPNPIPLRMQPALEVRPRARPTYPADGDQYDFHVALARAMVPRPGVTG